MGLLNLAWYGMLLLLMTAAVNAETEACASDPSACEMSAESGPLGSGDVTATVQGGPVGTAAAPYTVSGSLIYTSSFRFDSNNMFDLSGAAQGSNKDAAWDQKAPTDPPGPYGNAGQNGPNDVPILAWVEFGADNRIMGSYQTGTTLHDRLQVLVNVADTGSITITRQTLSGRSDADAATITLTSSLFVGATGVTPSARLTGVLPDRFVLEDVTREDTQAAAAAAPLDSLAQAVRAAGAYPDITPAIKDKDAGIITFTFSVNSWPIGTPNPATPDTQTFQVALAPPPPPDPCAGGGICCSGGQPKTGGVCRSASPGSCQLDSVCNGISADCPASPKKIDRTPCLWSPRRFYPMGSSLDAHDTKLMSVSAHDAKVMAVSAHDAAAWLAGQPDYDTEWPECEGVCFNGMRALRWDHPACCYVRPRGGYGYRDDRGERYADASAGAEAVSVSSFGYWRSRDWYCWKK